MLVLKFSVLDLLIVARTFAVNVLPCTIFFKLNIDVAVDAFNIPWLIFCISLLILFICSFLASFILAFACISVVPLDNKSNCSLVNCSLFFMAFAASS